MMQTAMAVLLIIFAAVCLSACLSIWCAIDDVKNSLENIRCKCDNTSEIETAKYMLLDCITKSHKELLTEIACLATKNNEDIKRMKGDYAVGDILRFDGIRWRVFGKDTLYDGRTRWKLFGENEEEYRMYTDAMPEGLEFLGHRDLSFD